MTRINTIKMKQRIVTCWSTIRTMVYVTAFIPYISCLMWTGLIQASRAELWINYIQIPLKRKRTSFRSASLKAETHEMRSEQAKISDTAGKESVLILQTSGTMNSHKCHLPLYKTARWLITPEDKEKTKETLLFRVISRPQEWWKHISRNLPNL